MKRKICTLRTGVLCLLATIMLSSSCKKDPEVIPDETLVKGRDISSNAFIKSDSVTKSNALCVTTEGDWKLYAGSNDKTINFSVASKTGSTTGTFSLGNKVFQVYCLEWSDGSRTVLGARKLPLEKQKNCRDLGGYKTTGGKIVKWGKIIRSGAFGTLTNADKEYVSSTGVKKVVDLRSAQEKLDAPSALPSSIEQYSINIEVGDLGTNQIMQLVLAGDENQVKNYFIDLNRNLIMNYQAEYQALFDIIESETNFPLIFHCTEGKDRAGLASVLFLSALGVDKETVIQDYLLTNTLAGVSLESIRQQYGSFGLSDAVLGCIYLAKSAQREYIESAFTTIESEYGSIQNYLTTRLHVDISKLKSKYLY